MPIGSTEGGSGGTTRERAAEPQVLHDGESIQPGSSLAVIKTHYINLLVHQSLLWSNVEYVAASIIYVYSDCTSVTGQRS